MSNRPSFAFSAGCCCCFDMYQTSSGWNMFSFDENHAPAVLNAAGDDYLQGRMRKKYRIPSGAGTLLNKPLAVDYLNERVYTINKPVSGSSTLRNIQRFPKHISDNPSAASPVISPTTVLDIDPAYTNSQVESITVDPRHEQIFYIVREVAGSIDPYHIFSVNYDGTGNTDLYAPGFLPDVIAGTDDAIAVTHIRYCKVNDRVYFVETEPIITNDTGTKTYIKSIRRDGSDEQTHIETATPLPVPATSRNIFSPRFSFAREKMYWAAVQEQLVSPMEQDWKLWEANLDGSSPTILYETPPMPWATSANRLQTLVVSQEKDAIYFLVAYVMTSEWEWMRYNLATAEVTTLANRYDWASTFDSNFNNDSGMELGCHLEPMGAKTKAA